MRYILRTLLSEIDIGKCAFFGCTNLTIKASKGSYAEKYAKEKELPFEAID